MSEHGTRQTYLTGCRCEQCTKANSRHCKQWRWRARGGSVNVDAAPVREHINSLPMSQSAVAAASGIARSTIRHIAIGGTQRVAPATAAALMRVTGSTAAGAHHVSARGARRRLQALGALGWSGEVLADRTGYTRANLYMVRDGRRTTITSDVDQRIRTTYDELQATIPVGVTKFEKSGISRTLNESAKRGYAPPLAWDDIDTDEAPNLGRQRNVYRPEELVEEFDFLTSSGESNEEAAARLGVQLESVRRAKERVHRRAA